MRSSGGGRNVSVEREKWPGMSCEVEREEGRVVIRVKE
jgi:hypothetical protein